MKKTIKKTPNKKAADPDPKSKKYDIVSIGDCTIDAFIKVEEATLNCNIQHESCQLCFSFADKIPYESLHMMAAGNCNNVAVGSSRLGLKAAYYGTVGGDNNANIIMDNLKKEKVGSEFMSVQPNHKTNFHFVLWYKGERTILIKHQPYDYHLPKGLSNTNWIYFSSVGPKGLHIHSEVIKFLKANPKIKMAFNPGTYQLRLGAAKLVPLFKRTEILFVNKEEGELLAGMKRDVRLVAEELHKMGPKIVVITDGLKGSYCLADGNFYYMGIYPHKPIEATGCGDAYATGFTTASVYGLSPMEAMRWGSRNGAGCATEIGPQKGLIYKKGMLEDLKGHPKMKAKLLA